MEKEITISARPVDQKLVETAAKSAAAEFEKAAGFEVKYTVDTELAAGSVGGIIIKGYGNRITVNNTLEERLKLLEERVSFFPLLLIRSMI